MKRKTITFLISAGIFMVAQGGQDQASYKYGLALVLSTNNYSKNQPVEKIPKAPTLTEQDLALLEKHSQKLNLAIQKKSLPLKSYCEIITESSKSENGENSSEPENSKIQENLPLAVSKHDTLTGSMLGLATVCFAVSLLDSNHIWQFFKKKH